MATTAPTVTRILIAVGFALSCFGLALFLWIAFGGPSPLKPEGYRITVPFDEATTLAQESDVRISGVPVGKVKSIELGDEGKAEAELEIQAAYAPLPADTRAILRQKTLLGETYVELSTGSDESVSTASEGDPPSGTIPEGGELPAAQVSDAVQLDEIFRAFDDRTRDAFQAWMQGQAAAFEGRGDDFSLAIASLDPFAAEADRVLRVLDSQRLAVSRLVRDGGEVFDALSERRGQLRGLVTNSEEVFTTTADRDAELEETFRIFPTFLRESRATLLRLDEFAQNADPLIQQLRPAARELSPTLIDLGELAPELEGFLRGLRGTIDAADRGLPATRELLSDDLPPLLTELDPFLADFNSIFEMVRLYRREITALLGNATASSLAAVGELGFPVNVLRTSAPLHPEALSNGYPQRLLINRSNPYMRFGDFINLNTGILGFLNSYETRHCDGAGTEGINAQLDPADRDFIAPTDVPESQALFDRIHRFSFQNAAGNPVAAGLDGMYNTDDLPAPPCVQQGDFQSIGVNPEQTQYQHVREQP
jgi:phospholipid/cholesterol/gamma-HCH transport system substrate-binding protein